MNLRTMGRPNILATIVSRDFVGAFAEYVNSRPKLYHFAVAGLSARVL